jgi:multidrug transporter EmrE-like cation transporter
MLILYANVLSGKGVEGLFFLALNIMCSISGSLVFKALNGKDITADYVMLFNYLLGACVSVFLCFSGGIADALSQQDLRGIVEGVRLSLDGQKNIPGSIGWAIVIGVVSGTLYLANLIVIRVNIAQSGASIGNMFGHIGAVITICVSIFIFRETPSAKQWIGILLALSACVISNLDPANIKGFRIKPALLAAMLFTGWIGSNVKIFQSLAIEEYKKLFLAVIFIVALFLNCGLIFHKKRRGEREVFQWSAAVIGMLWAIPNLFSSYFMIAALRSIPATVAYPVSGAATLALVSVLCFLIFKERLKKREYGAIGVTVLSIVVTNS